MKNDRLKILKHNILCQLKTWIPDSTNLNLSLIQILEEYKTAINRLVDRFEQKNMELTIERLKAYKKRSKLSKKRTAKIMKCIGEKKDTEKVWDKLNAHFEYSPSYILEQLQETPEEELQFSSLLNLHAINRLSAIAKMIQYCKENKIELKQFKEGRTPQRIKGWHKMSKITAITYGPIMESYQDTYLDNKGRCYPLLSELDYLMSLNPSAIGEEITRLKVMLNKQKDCNKPDKELELERISMHNKELLACLIKRNDESKRLISHSDAKVQEKYEEIKPTMKRKHENVMKKEKRMMKFMKVDLCDGDKTSNRTSPTGSIETMQEELINPSHV